MSGGGDGVWVLGLGGSTRPRSRSRLVLEGALAGARAAGARTSLWAVDEEPLPFHTPEAPPDPATERFLKAVRAADAFVWCTPAYHGSVSAPVKNLLDHIDALRQDRPPLLAGKVVGVASVGDGAIAPVQAAATLVQIAHALQALVVPLQVPVCHGTQTLSDEQIVDRGVAARLDELGRLVVATATALRPATGGPAPPSHRPGR
ncbi:NAD(P)H-dependent oxidoreductase [Streptomyces sp. Isolate_45]|uniref:NADPH-dependent FMN reductase n=1 Tax=Streptomyces sp. Isolate_45 TaxID=2950111 RepID=UPI002481DFFF|nr:NAD(P)H-dependent oxidoreductase [Streptomyces sp. Isolate_45]MDA5279822.1 NAD(P)H-dependent oxidoreductase [Streptomyces sp. Isolate_45]